MIDVYWKKFIMLFRQFIIIQITKIVVKAGDYWSVNFDDARNCQRETLLKNLLEDTNVDRCVSVNKGIGEEKYFRKGSKEIIVDNVPKLQPSRRASRRASRWTSRRASR